jgi:hypothetical protein
MNQICPVGADQLNRLAVGLLQLKPAEELLPDSSSSLGG